MLLKQDLSQSITQMKKVVYPPRVRHALVNSKVKKKNILRQEHVKDTFYGKFLLRTLPTLFFFPT